MSTSTVANVKKEVVLAAVTRHGWALEFASEELKRDKEVILAAVTKNGDALIFMHLKRCRETRRLYWQL